MRLETLGALNFSAAVLAIEARGAASQMGLMRSYALQITSLTSMTARLASVAENASNAVERIAEYSRLKEEAPAVIKSSAPDGWPSDGALLCCAVLCCAVLCCAVLCCAVLCCAVLCCAVLCCAVLCCAVLCCAASYLSAAVSQLHVTPLSICIHLLLGHGWCQTLVSAVHQQGAICFLDPKQGFWVKDPKVVKRVGLVTISPQQCVHWLQIEFKDMKMRYRPGLPLLLKGLNSALRLAQPVELLAEQVRKHFF